MHISKEKNMQFTKVNDDLIKISCTKEQIKNAGEMVAYFQVIQKKLVEAKGLIGELEKKLFELTSGFLNISN